MTDQKNTAQASIPNSLSDDSINAKMLRHGYQSPQTLIARLNQWIGLHCGEDSVTLLMYEAHKALSKLRAPVADELPEWEQISSKLERGEALTPLELFVYDNEPAGDGDAWRDQLAAALASAPVAGEAVYTLWVREANQAWTPTTAAFSIPGGEHQLFLSPAAPPASQAARILFPTHLRKMWSGGQVQAWLDEHQGVTAPTPLRQGQLGALAEVASGTGQRGAMLLPQWRRLPAVAVRQASNAFRK